jgi:hypothetical protein
MATTKATLEEMAALAENLASIDGLITAETLFHLEEARAEQLAEGAWLRAAESAGWMEAAIEEEMEAGFRPRW